MRSGEIEALGAVGGKALASFGRVSRDVHRAVAGRAFGALGVVGTPVRVMHDGISALAYGAVSGGLQAVPRGVGGVLGLTAPRDGRAIADTPPGAFALGALNGAIGDRIARDHQDLALELTVRVRGRAVQTDSAGLASAFPGATSRVAVFVHGLCEAEHAWRFGGPSYGRRLRADLGYTPVYVRYNTGLHVSDNGRRLAEVLDHLVHGWPVEVDELVLVGHSMGGLVARSACHYGEKDRRDWTDRLRHVFCLGSPHLGAPLERAANRAGHTLSRLPETRALAYFVNVRSAGIKDMRFGNCVEEDWCDCDPDEYLRDRCAEVPFLPTANYYFVGATLARDPDGRFARIAGDLLVQFASASGNGPTRRIPFEIENGCHIGRMNHLQLLNHPAVYQQLHGWLTRAPRQLLAPAAHGVDAAT